jgi:hypothetical protein
MRTSRIGPLGRAVLSLASLLLAAPAVPAQQLSALAPENLSRRDPPRPST